jgi:hypothetical protein
MCLEMFYLKNKNMKIQLYILFYIKPYHWFKKHFTVIIFMMYAFAYTFTKLFASLMFNLHMRLVILKKMYFFKDFLAVNKRYYQAGCYILG